MTAPPTASPVAKRVPHQRQGPRGGQRRSLGLAARPGRSRHDRLPRGRERLHRGGDRPHRGPPERLFEEIKRRIQETDLSVPVRKGAWWYYTPHRGGPAVRDPLPPAGRRAPRPTPRRGRARGGAARPERRGRRPEFFALGAFDVSAPTTGCWPTRPTTTATRATRCGSGTSTPATTCPTRSPAPTTARPGRPTAGPLLRHGPTTPCARTGCGATGWARRRRRRARARGGRRAVLPRRRPHQGRAVRRAHLGSKVTSEVWVLAADDPTGDFRVVEPRRQGVEYAVEHHGDRFLVVTNDDGAENFRLVEAPGRRPGPGALARRSSPTGPT